MEYTTLRNICLFVGLISFLVASTACTKEEVTEISVIPSIELISLSHDLIMEFEDKLIITIAYQDGDGDVGFDETDQFALFVRDVRLEEFDGFYIGPIAPLNSSIPVKGEFNIEFPNLFVFGNGETETTRFEIKMIDRSMNESNILTTENIIIKK